MWMITLETWRDYVQAHICLVFALVFLLISQPLALFDYVWISSVDDLFMQMGLNKMVSMKLICFRFK